jgi:hypothetical protein
MGCARSTHERDERCIMNFSLETPEGRRQLEMGLKEIEWQSGPDSCGTE